MAGRAGRTGPKPNVEGMSIHDIVNRSINICFRFISDENQPLEKRADVASRFVLKRISDKIDIEIKNQLDDNQVYLILDQVRKFISTAPEKKVLEIESKPS